MLNWIKGLFTGPSKEELKDLIDDLRMSKTEILDRLDAERTKAKQDYMALAAFSEENRKGYHRSRTRVYRAKRYIFEELGTIEELKEDPETFKHELKILDILDGKRNQAR